MTLIYLVVCADSRPAQLARTVNIPRVERRLLAHRARTWNSAIFARAPSKLCAQHLQMTRGILLWLASMARFSPLLGRGWTRAHSRRGTLPLPTHSAITVAAIATIVSTIVHHHCRDLHFLIPAFPAPLPMQIIMTISFLFLI